MVGRCKGCVWLVGVGSKADKNPPVAAQHNRILFGVDSVSVSYKHVFRNDCASLAQKTRASYWYKRYTLWNKVVGDAVDNDRGNTSTSDSRDGPT